MSQPRILANSIKSRRILLAIAGGISAFAPASEAADVGWNQADAGTFSYMDPANWVSGTINGLWDGSLTLTGTQTGTFDADTVLTTGLTFNYAGGFNVTLRGTGGNRSLTLGGDILVNTASTTRVITLGATTAGQALNVDLGGVTRALTVGSGRSLGFVNTISNGGIIMSGGTVNFSGANTYTGPTVVNAGNLSLNGAAGSVAFSDIFVRNTGTSQAPSVTFNSNTSGVTGTVRAKSVTLQGAGHSAGAVLSVAGNAGANSVDAIANALTVSSGFAIVTVTPNASRNARLEAGSFVRNAGTTVLMRGADLGVSPIASQMAGDANIVFGGTVALSGGPGSAGQTNIGILKGVYGDPSSAGTGTGLVTYDAANGARLLDAGTEYKAIIGDGQTELDNVRLVRATGDALIDIHLTQPVTTINSLSFRVSGAASGAGVTITGDAGASLKLASGTIFASQGVTGPTSADAMTISVPTLDLNGQEGVFISFTSGISNGNTPAPLQINSAITNDGGNGVTIGGSGEIIFGGSTLHTYTGATTINSGVLRLNKSVTNSGIPGDLVMNGGTLLKNGNAIPDTATVTLNGGTLFFDNTTSSGNNGHPETFANLIMNGGVIGHHGSNATFTLTGNATLIEGDLTMNSGGDLTVQGTTFLNGGQLIAMQASSTTSQNALTTLNQVAIQNTTSGEYKPVIVNAHASNLGGRVVLNGDVTFTGNATNANTTTIDTSDVALANQGVIALTGARTFSIGNGAANADLAIVPALTDNGATSGGIIKGGPGTLAMLGANSYTGPTSVDAGTLIVGAALNGTSAVTVANGATLGTDAAASIAVIADGSVLIDGTLAPGGLGANGTLMLDLSGIGKLDFGDNAALSLDLAIVSAEADRVHFATLGDWLSGSGTAVLNLGGSINYAATYTIFENVSTNGFEFAGITGYDTLNYSADVLQVGNDYQLSFEAIPEPAFGGLFLGGLAVLGAARRLRARRAEPNSSSNAI